MFTLLHNGYKWFKKKQEKSAVVILVGLDGAGKSTLMHGIRGEVCASEPVPTVGFDTKTMAKDNFTFTLFDVGGGVHIRRIWERYFPKVHAVVFVIDASDVERLDESGEQLLRVTENEYVRGKPLLIFANKQDLSGALSASEIAERIKLTELKDNRYSIVACTAKTPPGEQVDPRIADGLRWLTGALRTDYQKLNERVASDTQRQKEREAREKEERRIRAAEVREQRRKQREAEEAELGRLEKEKEKENEGSTGEGGTPQGTCPPAAHSPTEGASTSTSTPTTTTAPSGDPGGCDPVGCGAGGGLPETERERALPEGMLVDAVDASAHTTTTTTVVLPGVPQSPQGRHVSVDSANSDSGRRSSPQLPGNLTPLTPPLQPALRT
eukprot:Rmarinus@m.25279